MQRKMRLVPFFLLILVGLLACGQEAASDLTVEALPEVQPNLPEVPTLPPPPQPVQLADNSYTVYGVRQRIKQTMDTDVEVTGYIADVYVPPECPEGEHCPPAAAPHMWLADTPDETDEMKRLTVVGYAENQASIDEAIAEAQAGRREELTQEQRDMGMIPIPVDFAKGAKVKVKGRFTRLSGTGFNISHGLLEYRDHELLEAAPGSGEEGS
jgi:hypothetical protein